MMMISNKLNDIFNDSSSITINDKSRIVIMSDCHRGDGNNNDNFLKNSNIFKAALQYYYNENFTYIELGDGDEMWEVKNYEEIIREHIETFKLIKKFYDQKRFIMILGNHDKEKQNKKIINRYFAKYYSPTTNKVESLFENIKVQESLILKYNNHDIFLIHGHQVDLLNSTFWKISRFLVRYLWQILEYLGIKDPTSAAKNYSVSKRIEKRLEDWSIDKSKILIAGHTHRPIFPQVGSSLYFNDGSCIHPDGITCLEIKDGKISLVKWSFKIRKDNTIYVGRNIIVGNTPINDFFSN